MVRGKPVGNALATLKFMPKKGAELVNKVLESAIANAEHNHGADIDELKDVEHPGRYGPVLKRFPARAKGRGNRIVKRNSHITDQRQRREEGLTHGSESQSAGHSPGYHPRLDLALVRQQEAVSAARATPTSACASS